MILLKSSCLYILSGLPGVGKSTFLKNNNIPEEMILSSDKIRRDLLGTKYDLDNGVLKKDIPQECNEEVFSYIKNAINIKLKEGLTVFVDSVAADDPSRESYIHFAKKNNVDFKVLIFDEDIEVIKERNKNREFKVSDNTIEKFASKFEKTSKFPYLNLKTDDIIKIIPKNILTSSNFDVVGDVHGLFNELIKLLINSGYSYENGKISHPKNKKIIFLGDVVDRGEQSIELLMFLYKNKDNCFLLRGNHEEKLLKNIELYNSGEKVNGSTAVLRTFSSFLGLSKQNKVNIENYLKETKFYYIFDNFVFTHANIVAFDPLKTLNSDLLYGSARKNFTKADTDKAYQELFDLGINKYTLIRGHIPQISSQKNVYSLEEEQAFAGNLVLLKFDEFYQNQEKNINEFIIREKSEFNYKKYLRRYPLQYELQKLMKDKLVSCKEDSENILFIYKYAKKVFFDNLWNVDKNLLRTRGLVLDFSGKIAQHPFTKVFNYLENDAGKDIPDDEIVVAAEKKNGFLGCITKHPFKDQLLITTTGSFDSEFVNYIKSFIDRELNSKLMSFFSKNNLTLMFEVIHPDDPHIISYPPEDFGLHLIGARGKEENDIEKTEEELDLIAKELSFKRTKYFRCTFKEAKEIVSSAKDEGLMIRKNDENQKILLKIKSPFYLTTKFLGRMGTSKIKNMFNSPSNFKQQIDEEFYSIVDSVINTYSLEQFLELTNEEKIEGVRNIILEERA